MEFSNIKISADNKLTYGGGVISAGDKVRHFKYEFLTDEGKLENQYIYSIIGFGIHSETHEPCVIYESLYTGGIWIRPAANFISEVDHDKYPNIKQKYRFEKI